MNSSGTKPGQTRLEALSEIAMAISHFLTLPF
jgi:hypothetical protein